MRSHNGEPGGQDDVEPDEQPGDADGRPPKHAAAQRPVAPAATHEGQHAEDDEHRAREGCGDREGIVTAEPVDDRVADTIGDPGDHREHAPDQEHDGARARPRTHGGPRAHREQGEHDRDRRRVVGHRRARLTQGDAAGDDVERDDREAAQRDSALGGPRHVYRRPQRR